MAIVGTVVNGREALIALGPLVGMSLLRGSELRIEAADGGEVEIRPLARP